jgi:protein SCO1/2
LTLACGFALAGCAPRDRSFGLTDVTGHLPDLGFALTADSGRPMNARALADKVVLLYFGYTHCPDVCPETLAKLTDAVGRTGAAGRDVRILFVSVDPARDTPQSMHAYVTAFDAAHAVGLTGTQRQIEDLARRYRVAYQTAEATADGQYEVTHSSAVYVFDRTGRARLIATATDTPDRLAGDLRRLLDQPQDSQS